MKRTRDNATFDPRDLETVWGPKPYCCVTTEPGFVSLHHILGRGLDFGARPGDEERSYFSSVYNGVPLGQGVHHGPFRDKRGMRHDFLEHAAKKVEQAIIHQGYETKPRDEAFLEIAEKWKKEHPCS